MSESDATLPRTDATIDATVPKHPAPARADEPDFAGLASVDRGALPRNRDR